MKKSIISGAAAIIFGLLIALGPQFLFKVCGVHDDSLPRCYWAARAELCMGILIAAMGICMLFLSDMKTQLGMSISIFLMGIIALLIPFDKFISFCKDAELVCRRVTFPILTVLSSLVVLGALINMAYLEKKTKS